jgi:short-subunit dehydrogenase
VLAARRGLNGRRGLDGRRALAGRRVLVTGGSSGIGAAAAVALRATGATVAVTGRDPVALAAVAQRCGGMAITLDLTVPGAVDDLVAQATSGLGGLDTLVCAAGGGWAGPVDEMSDVEIDQLIDINLRVPIHTVRAALDPLLASPCGGVVLVGSIAGLVGVAREVVYSATKAGLAGYADALRAEMGDRLAVSLVSPGAVDTPFFARRNRPYERGWPRPMPVERVAAAIVEAAATGRPATIVPRWMGVAARLHGGAPGLYRALAERLS